MSSARSTISMARSTPAQKPRGLANHTSIRLFRAAVMALLLLSPAWARMGNWAG
jgi:hypothetical protein